MAIKRRCFRGSGGGQFIQILNVRPLADGKRMFLELVPRVSLAVLRDLFYV